MVVGRLRSLRERLLLGDVLVLYGAHLAGLLVPLATVPYLARVLRPDSWGVVVLAQSFALWLVLIIEYGFDLSGTRAIARARIGERTVRTVVASIQGGKLIVLALISSVVVLSFLFIPLFAQNRAILAWAAVFAVVRGMSPFWYFLGQERLRGPAAIEALAKVLAAVGVFVLVRGPDDAWRVLALQAGASSAALVVLTARLYRDVAFEVPSMAQSVEMLREGAGVFVFRAASGLYLQANALILGLLTTPQVVAHFGGAEKIVRAAINLLHPLSQGLFPRLSRLVVSDPAGARRIFRLCLAAMLGLGVVMGLTAFWAAEPLVRLFLGPGYEAAVPVLRILSLLPPFVAIGTVFGIHWALPRGLDQPFYRLVVVGGVLNIVLAVWMAPRLGAPGMALSVLAADGLVATGLLALFLLRRGVERPIRTRLP